MGNLCFYIFFTVNIFLLFQFLMIRLLPLKQFSLILLSAHNFLLIPLSEVNADKR